MIFFHHFDHFEFYSLVKLLIFILFMEESRLSSRDQKLTTIKDIITFTQTHKHSKILADRSKKQIQEWLSMQAKVLMDKQQRNQHKQQKLKELQQRYERQRVKKQKQIEQKLVMSQKNKNKNISSIQKKLGQLSKRHQSVYSRAITQKQNQLEKHFDTRREYINQDLRTGSRMSNTSDLTSKTRPHRGPTSLENQESIDRRIQQINSRLEKAHNVTRERQAVILNRIREHNTQQIQLAQSKAAKSLQHQINEFSHKIASRLQGADLNKQKYDKSIEKRQEQKHKAFSQKLQNYHTNIRHLQDEQQSKLQQLNKKFEKNVSSIKFWKDQKGEIYHKKFLANMSVLQQKKIMRADQIIQKHLQITNKNKVYRERKHNLFQAIKCDPASPNS